jgi:hypothetical protein
MQKNNNIRKEAHSSFFNLIKREELDEPNFVNWMDVLHKDLSSFWEKMND